MYADQSDFCIVVSIVRTVSCIRFLYLLSVGIIFETTLKKCPWTTWLRIVFEISTDAPVLMLPSFLSRELSCGMLFSKSGSFDKNRNIYIT